MRILILAAVVLLVSAADVWADQIEFRTGAKLEGRIVARDDKQVKIETTTGGRTSTRTVPLDRLRAIVTGGQREVLDEDRRQCSGQELTACHIVCGGCRLPPPTVPHTAARRRSRT